MVTNVLPPFLWFTVYNHLYAYLFHASKKCIHSLLQSQINAALQMTEEHLKPRGTDTVTAATILHIQMHNHEN